MSYTKGEWFAHREGFSTVYVEARIGGGMLQEVAACGPTEGGPDEQEDNALLIAAAPDLLDALKVLLDDINGLMSESDGVTGLHLNGDVAPWSELDEGGRFERMSGLSAARAAIAKALGRQQ